MMRLSKSVLLLLMLMVCLFFISLSAFSGEHPWDSEGGGTGSDGDTTYSDDDSITHVLSLVESGESRDTGGMMSLSSTISIWIYNYYYDLNPMQVEKSRRAAYPKRTYKRNYSENF